MEKVIIKNELTWSFSRDRLFKDCRRAYYYNYYASWGGWVRDADEFIRKAYMLKNIRSIDAWIGDLIHQLIKWILGNLITGNKILYEEAIKKARQLLTSTWEQSRNKMWINNVKYNLNLFEHYYGCQPSREELVPKLKKVTKSIYNIYNSGLIEWLGGLPPGNILRIDELDSFDFEGIKAFAVPDFAVKDSEFILYDWKTGKPSDKDLLQLSCYTFYASYKWKIDIKQIKLIPAYLSEQKLILEPVKPMDIETVREYMRSSIKDMKTVLSNVKDNKADQGLCFKTNDLWKCDRCKFREICS